jgi:hypothetical protein
MTNRLKAYMEFLHRLPTTLTRTNFATAETELYACILQFLAQAIQILLQAFLEDSDVRNFESKCNELGMRVEIEASNCDRSLAAMSGEI